MGWRDYYRLLKKYKGDLSKASPEELEDARRGNPNTPEDALKFALERYKDDVKELILAIVNLEGEISYVKLATKVGDYIEGEALVKLLNELKESGDIFEPKPNVYKIL